MSAGAIRYVKAGMARLQTTLRAGWRERASHDMALVLATQLVSMVLGIASSAVLARSLGPAGLSAFVVIGAAKTIGGNLADFGLRLSAVRYIAADAKRDAQLAQRTAGVYARLKLTGSLALTMLALALAEPVAGWLNLPQPAGKLLVWLGGLGLLATAVSGLVATIQHALGQFQALVATQLGNVVLTVVLMAALWLADRLTLASALVVGIVTSLAAAGLGYGLLPNEWRQALHAPVSMRGEESRRLLSFSRWMWLANVLGIITTQVDILFVNHWLAAHQVGIYALARNLAMKADVVNHSLHTVLMPKVASLTGRAAYRAYARRALLGSLLLVAPLALALPLVRPFVLLVYGPEFAASINVFFGLMAVVLFDLFAGPVLLLAFPMNRPRLLAASDGARVTTLFVASALLIPGLGMAGAVLAKLAAKLGGALVTGTGIAAQLRQGQEAQGDQAPLPEPDTSVYTL